MSAASMSSSSLSSRIALAVALTAVFYVLAVSIALGLIVTPIALWASSGRGNVWVTIAMVGAGLSILRAIVPERARFDPPGPVLRREDHPELHALLDRVAAAAGERPADLVYLDLDVNAAVLEHRGKRIMLIGLGLLTALDAGELEVVIAHEYGHYAGGDTRLAQWIWRTRVAVLKAAQGLAESDSWFRRNVVRWPFHWYALAFLRITNAVGRRAEFAADAFSAQATSAEAAGRALRRVSAVGPAFAPYWAGDVAPMLGADRLPRVAAGFRAMTTRAELAGALDELVAGELKLEEPDPYASHPTLRERLTALGIEPEAAAPAPVDVPATELVADIEGLERELLVLRFGKEIASFEPVDWDDAGEVHLEEQRRRVRHLGDAFGRGLTVGDAGTAAADLPRRRPRLRELLPEEGDQAEDDELDRLALNVLVSLVIVALSGDGARVTAPPGEPILVRDGDDALPCGDLLGAIAAGEQDAATWTTHAIVARRTGVPLGEPNGTAPA